MSAVDGGLPGGGAADGPDGAAGPPPASRRRVILRQSVGSPVLFTIVYASLASAVYFSLGVVAGHALGLTPLVFLAAAGFFGLTAMTYVEGASLHPERGGATVFARYAFNELISFVAGWAIMLDYIILIAVTCFSATQYLRVFWQPLGHHTESLLLALAFIAFVVLLNIRGINGRRSARRIGLLAIGDLVLQLSIVVLGLVLFFDPHTLLDPIQLGTAPSWSNLVFALTITVIAFTSLESAAGLAGEVRAGRGALRRLIVSGMALVVIGYVGIAVVAVTALPVHDGHTALGGRYVNAPVLGIVTQMHPQWLREGLKYLVGVMAPITLVAAASAAMLGLSRLGYSLSTNRQIPSGLGALHPRRSTPYVLIVIAGLMAAALVVPEDLEFLIGIYAFGAMLAFTLAHLSICRLRYTEPERARPYAVPLSVSWRGGRLPLPAVLGVIVSGAGWLAVMVVHEPARYVGLGWLAAGLVLYVVYRRADESSLLRRVTVAPEMLRAPGGPPRAGRRTRLRLDPRAAVGHRARRGHGADRRAARRRGAHRRRRDRHRHDRGRLDLRDADGAAAGRAPARGAGAARPRGARAREGGGGGVRRRARRHGDRPRARCRPRDRGGGTAAWRGSDRARRRGALAHPRRRAPGGRGPAA